MKATVITDASFCHRRKGAGWAAWVRIDDRPDAVKGYGVLKKNITNSTDAEVYAALNGIWLAAHHGATNLLVRSDCMVVIQLLNGEVKSPRMLERWNGALQRSDMQGLQLRGQHVRGHKGTATAAAWVNDWCDRKAKIAMNCARRGIPCLKIY